MSSDRSENPTAEETAAALRQAIEWIESHALTQDRSPFPALKRARCPFCAGKKTVGYAICPHCHGSGHIDVMKVTP